MAQMLPEHFIAGLVSYAMKVEGIQKCTVAGTGGIRRCRVVAKVQQRSRCSVECNIVQASICGVEALEIGAFDLDAGATI
jgi:hypothetical protein